MMKQFLLILLFFACNSFAQVTIEKVDGSQISAPLVHFNIEKQRITYKVADSPKKQKIKYKDLKSVSSDLYSFRTFKSAKKYKGYFIKAETPTKTLGFISYSPSSGTATGFRPNFSKVAVAVFDAQGNMIEDVEIKRGISDSDIAQRAEVISMIKKHFADCPMLINELTSFTSDQNDTRIFKIIEYFQENRKMVSCK